MQRFSYILLFIFASFSLPAQNRHVKKGDEEVARLAYAEAVKHYKKAARKGGAETYYKLGKCFYRMHNYESAAKWYALAWESENNPKELYFEYGHILLQEKKYEAARDLFLEYAKRAPEDKRGQHFATALNNMEPWYRDSARYNLRLLPFNSRFSDFGAYPYLEGLVFASAREEGIEEIIDEGMNQSFLNLYYCKQKDHHGNNWTSPDPMKGELKSKLHESSFCLGDSTSQEYWFCRNREPKRRFHRSDLILLEIFAVKMKGLKGEELIEFPYNQESFSNTHPSLSSDGQTLVFVSDRPGGFGGKDLYQCLRSGSGWSEPRNLGEPINSPGDEVFPFLHADGSLYFSSDGHPGFGHLDIFKVVTGESLWVKNIGAPLNSAYDDFAYYLKPGMKEGFFSSNRPGGKGDDDIYAFSMTAPETEIKIKDSISGFPIERAKVVFFSSTTEEELSFSFTDSLGQVSFDLDRRLAHRVKVIAPGFEEYWLDIEAVSEANPEQRNYQISLYNPPPAITAIVVDESSKQKLKGAKVSLISVEDGKPVIRETDRYGRFSAKLQPLTVYQFQVSIEGYYTFSSEISTEKDRYDGDTIIPMKLIPVEVGKVFVLEKINYDFGRFELRPDASPILDKWVKLLTDNPGISIELSSHTDSRGEKSYNQQLSELRAAVARNYLVYKGIDEGRVESVGYGEVQLLNKCRDGIRCEEKEHFKNRRTEVKIIGYKGEKEVK